MKSDNATRNDFYSNVKFAQIYKVNILAHWPLMPLGNKPLPEPMLTQIYATK